VLNKLVRLIKMTVQHARTSVIVRNLKTDMRNFLKEFTKEKGHTMQFQNF